MAEAPIIAVSDKANLQRVCRLEDPGLFDAQGRTVSPKKRKLVAQFTRGGAPDWVLQAAQERFDFRGRGADEPISLMVGVFDSAAAAKAHKWSEEEHDAVVRELRDTANPYWIIVEQPKVPAPWKSYDKLTVQGQRTSEKVAAKNLELAAETGATVEDMIAYERQNRNDAKILALYEQALEEQRAGEPAEELVEA